MVNVERFFFYILGRGGKREKVCETVVASSEVFFAVGAACFPGDNTSAGHLLMELLVAV